MLNQLVLVGRLTKNPEVRKSGDNTFANFTLAFDNVGKETTSFIDAVAFNKTAEALMNFSQKGDLLGIVGAIRQRKYTTKEGQNRSVIEVVVNEVQFLTPKKEEPAEPNPAELPPDDYEENIKSLDKSGVQIHDSDSCERPPLADGWHYDENGKAVKDIPSKKNAPKK